MAWKLALMEAWRAFRSARGATLSSTLIITLSLSILGVLGLIALVLDSETREARSWITAEVFFSEDASDRHIDDVRARLIQLSDVIDAHPVSKQQALERFRQFFDSELIDALDTNPLPRSLLIELSESGRSPARLGELVETVSTWPGVELVQADVEWLTMLNRLSAGSIIVLALLLASVGVAVSIVIARTIGLGISARASVVEVQRLLGIPEWLIRRPFILMGIVQGMMGGILSASLLVLSSITFGAVPLVGESISGRPIGFAALSLIALGTFLGWWGSRSALATTLPSDPWFDAPEQRK